MSKKMNATQAAITATENTIIEAATHYSLQKCFELNPNASLRKLAQATGINYGVLTLLQQNPIVDVGGRSQLAEGCVGVIGEVSLQGHSVGGRSDGGLIGVHFLRYSGLLSYSGY